MVEVCWLSGGGLAVQCCWFWLLNLSGVVTQW
jgi:hypothetical protein